MLHSLCLVLLAALLELPVMWDALAPGLDLAYLPAAVGHGARDSSIVVLRIDPNRWALEFGGVSQAESPGSMTAREWCERLGFSAAINAGMFDTDYKTHVGYLKSGDHTNSGDINAYQSVAAYGPRKGRNKPSYRIFDLDSPGVTVASIVRDYRLVVQNLRLIKRPGMNRWSRQENRWSEAALGEDDAGRILFIFSHEAFSMHELNRILLAAGIGIVAAQHLEGGPLAQLFVHAGDVEMELSGSYETGFRESDTNEPACPVPNILGIRPLRTLAPDGNRRSPGNPP